MESVCELFVEVLKMRPSAERVIAALVCAEAMPMYHQTGLSIAEIAVKSGLKPHVVRARLQDLRRLGLVESAKVWTSSGDRTPRYENNPSLEIALHQTGSWTRRAKVGKHSNYVQEVHYPIIVRIAHANCIRRHFGAQKHSSAS